MMTYNPPRYLFRRYTILRNIRRGKSFLEIGAGNLKLSCELLNYFNNGIALDFEPGVKNILATLPKQVQDKLTVKIGDFLQLKPKQQFDCIVACEVMEHIDNDLDFLKKINSHLNTGGQVVISVPAKDKYWSVHDEVVGHFRRYHKQQTEKLFADAGFKNVRVLSYGFPFINGLRFLRIAHGKQQSKQKSGWSKQEQTKKSGIGQIPTKYNIVGALVNPLTFYPLNLISTLFDNMDLSEGYVITATK